MAMMQTDHSMFTTSDDEELYDALRRVRTAEVVTAVSSYEAKVNFLMMQILENRNLLSKYIHGFSTPNAIIVIILNYDQICQRIPCLHTIATLKL